jgi:hypothetical protein
MAATDQPDVFIDGLEQIRIRLKDDFSYEIKDEDFITDVLGKLPKGSDDKSLGPYQVMKRMIEKEIEKSQAHQT